MSAGLIERLRAACQGHPHAKIAWPHRILHEAADEIDVLRADSRRLRSALMEARQFIEFHEKDENCVFDAGVSVRAALSEAQP